MKYLGKLDMNLVRIVGISSVCSIICMSGGCRKSRTGSTMHQKSRASIGQKNSSADIPTLEIWQALLEQGALSVNQTKNCKEKHSQDERTILGLVANVAGGGLHVALCAKDTACSGKAAQAVRLTCDLEVEKIFTCKLVSDDVDQAGRAYLGLTFSYLGAEKKIPADSITCI